MAPSKLPYDSISSVFEDIGKFDLEISAVIVVCGGFFVLWRHGGERQDADKTIRARRGDIEPRDDGRQGRGQHCAL